MNAVNLAPRESRRRDSRLPVSPPTLALLGGLIAVGVAAFMYLSAERTVQARRAELARTTAAATAWKSTSASYTPFVIAAQQRVQQIGAVRQLAASRYAWENLLGQLSRQMPAQAALSTLTASTAPSATASSGTGASPAASAPAAAATAAKPAGATSAAATSVTAAAAAATAGATPPSVQLSGCAASQPVVAETMVRLHEIAGVTNVALSSSTDNGTAASGSGTGGASSGGCPFPVQFQVSLTFAPASGAPSTSASPAAAASSPAAPSSPGASSPSPTASVGSSSSTGSAQ